MAQRRTTELTAIDTVAGADVFLVEDVSSGATRKATTAQVAAGIGAELGIASDELVSFRDEFDRIDHGWRVVEKTDGASHQVASSLSALGFPSGGALLLGVDTTALAKIELIRPIGLALDVGTPIVFEYCLTVVDAGDPSTIANDESKWIVGQRSPAGDSTVVVLCDDGVASLVTYQGGVPALESITLPAWTERLRIRLTITPTGTLVEAAADAGAFAELLDGSEVPDQVVYLPFVSIHKESHAGDRVLAIDYVAGSGRRAASLLGTFDPDGVFEVPGEALAADGSVPLEGDLDAGGKKIVNLGAPSSGSDAATRSSSETAATTAAQSEANLRTAAAALTTDLSVNGKRLQNVADPSAAQDAATKTSSEAAAVIAAAAALAARSVLAAGLATGGGALNADRTITVTAGAAGDIAAVGRAAAAGASGKAADASHVHDGGAVTVSAVKTADFALANTDEMVLVDDTAERIDIQLPAPSARKWMIQKVAGSTNGIRLIRAGTEKINTVAASYDLPGSTTAFAAATPQAWLLYSDGTDWFVA